METKIETFESQVKNHAIDKLTDGSYLVGTDMSELHHKLFNEYYFVIGYYQAEQMLLPYGIFNAIGKIQEYEKENFGEVTTDCGSSEKVCNMLAYILGEELLNQCITFTRGHDRKISQRDIKTPL